MRKLWILLFIPLLIGWVQVVPIHEDVPSAGGTDYTADTNCRGAWLFADDLTDASGEGNTLTDNGSIAYSTDRPSGFSTGKSADFDGSTDYLTRTHTGLSTNFPGKSSKQDWAYAMWFKIDNLPGIDAWIFNKTASYKLWLASVDYLQHYQKDSGATTGTAEVYDGVGETTWYHIVISCNGDGTNTVVTMWLSVGTFGSLINGSTDTLTGVGDVEASSLENFGIGAKANGSAKMDGQIYQPIIFDRTLSPSEAQDLYDTGITGAD